MKAAVMFKESITKLELGPQLTIVQLDATKLSSRFSE